MSNNVCNNVAYLNSIDQKHRFALLNVPPVRYDNLATNPYNLINPSTGVKYTKYDLDMRRKSEILKYSSNRMSTQTNSLTKAQKYAQAVVGSYQSRTYSQMYIDKNSTNGILNPCPTVKKPTTASDVPGPPILLYDDPNVPLYNLVNDADGPTYGIINQDINTYTMVWNNTFPVNVSNITGNSTITSIYVLYPTTVTLNYTITTPVSIYITGNLLSGALGFNSTNAFTLSTQSINLNVNYSYSSVTLSPATTISFTNSPSLTFDISVNKQNPNYSASCYLGLLTISNLILPVQKGFIYDIQVGISYSINYTSALYNEFCNAPITTSYINASANKSVKTNVNCTLNRTPSVPVPFPSLNIYSI